MFRISPRERKQSQHVAPMCGGDGGYGDDDGDGDAIIVYMAIQTNMSSNVVLALQSLWLLTAIAVIWVVSLPTPDPTVVLAVQAGGWISVLLGVVDFGLRLYWKVVAVGDYEDEKDVALAPVLKIEDVASEDGAMSNLIEEKTEVPLVQAEGGTTELDALISMASSSIVELQKKIEELDRVEKRMEAIESLQSLHLNTIELKDIENEKEDRDPRKSNVALEDTLCSYRSVFFRENLKVFARFPNAGHGWVIDDSTVRFGKDLSIQCSEAFDEKKTDFSSLVMQAPGILNGYNVEIYSIGVGVDDQRSFLTDERYGYCDHWEIDSYS